MAVLRYYNPLNSNFDLAGFPVPTSVDGTGTKVVSQLRAPTEDGQFLGFSGEATGTDLQTTDDVMLRKGTVTAVVIKVAGLKAIELTDIKVPTADMLNAFGFFFGRTFGLGEELFSGSGLKKLLVGNDSIFGSSGDDQLIGYSGADVFSGGSNLALDSSRGRDGDVVDYSVEGGSRGVIISLTLGKGTDSFGFTDRFSGIESIVGTGRLDTIVGNNVANSLRGEAGDDRLEGLAGNDLLDGGIGNDTILGGDGNDTVYGGIGNDTVRGGNGNDTLNGDEGNDKLFGDAGTDSLYGGIGNDTLDGGAGADRLEGYFGNDIYVVDNASDQVMEFGGAGFDTVNATASFNMRSSEIEVVNLLGSANLNATGSFSANRINGNTGANQLLGLEGNDVLSGGAGNDILDGGDGNDTIFGGTGNDTIQGGTGNDVIRGDDGNDTLNGGTGNDSLSGGLGNDTYWVDSASDVVIEASGQGTDTVISFVEGLTLQANVENLTLAEGVVTGTGNALDNVISGNSTDNNLSGGDGNDTLDGGLGADTLTGGTGDDTYKVDNQFDRVIESSGEGTDTVIVSVNGYKLDANVENLVLAAGVQEGSGNALANVLTGNSVDNVLAGNGGADILTGGAGADTFVVDTDLVDQITDFEQGFDHIEILVQGLKFTDLTLTQIDPDTVEVNLAASGQHFLTVNSAAPLTLASGDFIFI
jgi:Ca2+-binding RTX toxin-like protein